MSQTVYELFRNRALSQPGQPAVLASGMETATFGELLEFVETFRDSLHRYGIGRGSRLGILLPERVQMAVAHLAVKSTCVSVPMNPDMTTGELMAMVEDLQVDGLLIGDALPDQLRNCAGKLELRLINARGTSDVAGFFEVQGEVSTSSVDTARPTPDDVALLLQTSGTTATPKTVAQSHANRAVQLTRFSRALEMRPADRCMNMMPIYHTTGIGSEFLAPLISGASVVFVNLDPGTFESTVAEHRPTWFNLVPSMHQAVLATLEGRSAVFRNSSLRFARSSSARMPAGLRDRIQETYGIPLVDSYGSTESGSISFSGLPNEDSRAGSVGKPIHDGVVIMASDGNMVSNGTKGEICVSGPTVITAYENNLEANVISFLNGRYRTGDEGYIDKDGFLYVTGRLRESVNRGGEKISLAEIDEAILKVEGIAQGASFAAPHPILGYEIYAAVVAAEGRQLQPAEIRERFASQLSWAKVPKRVFVVPELPFNLTGKILREKLIALLDESTDHRSSAADLPGQTEMM